MKTKLSFLDALEALSEGAIVRRESVRADALARRVWVAEWHLPGCLSESECTTLTKASAIAAALDMAADADGPPRGMRADLQRCGRSQRVAPGAWARGAITTVQRCALADIVHY